MSSTRLVRLSVACAAAGVVAFPAAPVHAEAPGNGQVTVGIRPSDEADWFHVDLLPGEKSDRSAVVSNLSGSPVDLLIYPAAATNAADGGFSLDARDRPLHGVGSWTRLPVTTVHVPARASSVVPFQVAVPVGTTPGDYSGGIIVERMTQGIRSGDDKSLSLQVNVVQRVGARIYLRVAGEARPSLTAGALTWQKTGRGGTFSMPITNTGNVRLRPTGRVRFHGFHLPAAPVDLSRVEELLPGSTVLVTATLPERPRFGWGDAVATIDAGAGVNATGTTEVRFVPWLQLAGMAILIIVLAWAARRYARFLRRARVAIRLADALPDAIDLPARSAGAIR